MITPGNKDVIISPPNNFRMPSYLYYLQLLDTELRFHLVRDDICEMGYGAMSLVAAHYLGVDRKDLAINPEKEPLAKALLYVVEGINIDALSGNTIAEKGISLAQLIVAADPLKNMRWSMQKDWDKIQIKVALAEAREELKELQETVIEMKKGEISGADVTKEKTVENLMAEGVMQSIAQTFLMLRKINKLVTISFDTQYDLVPEPYGEYYVEDFGGISDLHEMDLSTLTPDKIEDLVTGKLLYKRPATRKAKKRIILLAYDRSSSMSTGDRKIALKAFFLKLSAIEGLELLVASFFTDLGPITICRTPEEIMEAFEKRDHYRPGTTKINEVIEQIHQLLKSNSVKDYTISEADRENVEVFLVNDGEDRVENKALSFRTHAVSLHGPNEDLKTICLRSGGTYNSLKT